MRLTGVTDLSSRVNAGFDHHHLSSSCPGISGSGPSCMANQGQLIIQRAEALSRAPIIDVDKGAIESALTSEIFRNGEAELQCASSYSEIASLAEIVCQLKSSLPCKICGHSYK